MTKIKILGKIGQYNSFERIYRKWFDIMVEHDLFSRNKEIVGIKSDKKNKNYVFYWYKNELNLKDDNVFLPDKLLNYT